MARPRKTWPDVQGRLECAKAELDEALISGADTAPFRRRIADIEDELAAAAALVAQQDAEAAAIEHAAVMARAAVLAREAAARLARVLAGLRPPRWPLPTDGDRHVVH